MKENSIEEDIKIIENFINWLTIDFEYNSGNEIKAIEHLLSDYKKLQKENEELKNQEATARRINELLVQRYSNSIPIQKVKDKIKSNKEIINKTNDGDLIYALNQENKVLQKLLGENNGNR